MVLDAVVRPYSDIVINWIGSKLCKAGLTADILTVGGLFVGLFAVPCIAFGYFYWAFALVVLNRLCDGFDGAVARASNRLTVYGGLLDIACDFVFSPSVPFGFALYSPDYRLAASLLIWSMMACGSSFLAYSIGAEKVKISTTARGPNQSMVGGLLEGVETMVALFNVAVSRGLTGLRCVRGGVLLDCCCTLQICYVFADAPAMSSAS